MVFYNKGVKKETRHFILVIITVFVVWLKRQVESVLNKWISEYIK